MIRFNLKSNRFLSSLVLGLFLTCAMTAWGDATLFNVNFADETTEQIRATTSGASWVAKTYDGYNMSFGSKNADAGVIDIINGTGLRFTGNNMNNYNCLAIPLTLTAGNKVTAVVTLADATKIKYNWVSGSLPAAPNNGSSGTTYGTNSTTNTLEYTPASAGSYVLYLGRSGSSSGKIVVSIQITQAEDAACVAPTSVGITGTTSYTEGQTISLTAAATGGTGTASYQWYKGGTAEGNKLTGATNATYTKASCTTADAGNYYCIISTGSTCSTASSACAVSVATVPVGTSVYLKPNSTWSEGNERYAVYCFGDGDQWYDMSLVADACGGPIYTANVDEKYTGYIFCRMNGDASANNWDNRWDQTGNLTAANGCYCTITGGHGYSVPCTFNQTPFSVCVSGTWLAFKGETITLNASCAGATHFQWYKGSDELSGQTSATLTISNCDYSDGGNYSCKAWNVGGEENAVQSSNYGVRVPRLAIQTGGGGDRKDLAFVRANTSDETATCEVYLGVAWDYEMMVIDGIEARGNTGTMTSNNCTNWTMDQVNNSQWCRIHTTKEGTYHFTLSFSNSTYVPVKLSAIYPPMKQTAGLKVYIENTPAMQDRGWNNSSIYYRIGKGKYTDGDDGNWTAAQLMALVPGTARYLYTTTPGWADNFWVWHIANNAGHVDGKFPIYKTNTGDSYVITESSNFNGDEIIGDMTIYLKSSPGEPSTDPMNNNCAFYGYDKTVGMLTHTATVNATTNGKIRVTYTHHDGSAQSYEAKTGTTLSGLAHTCILTISGVPDCGYKIKTLKVNGVDIASGSTHILDTDATITATFEDETYSVTFHTDGGTINSGEISTYKHGTGATLPTDVTKAGEAFGGWYDNSELTGSPISSISTTDCGDKEYWVGWSTCPAYCSGETVYKFEVNSSVSDGNICSSGNNPKAITKPSQLSALTGGTLEGYISNNSSWNNLTFSSGRITYANSDKGVLNITLDCPIREGDLIRFNNYSGSNSKYNYLRHTSYSTSTDQLTLNASKTATEIQQIIAPAAFDGKTELFIVPGSRTTGISYFEIIRPVIITLDAATNGGTVGGNGTKEISAANGDVIGLTRAAKDGYSFKGWFTAPSGGSPVSDAYTVSGCTTLYAQFEDCPESGSLYKFEVGTGLTNGAVTANSVAFDFNTANYLSELIGGTLITDGSAASKVLIANTDAISIQDNAAYLRIDLDCALKEGDAIKSTVAGATIWVNAETSRPSSSAAAPVVLPVGTENVTPIPDILVGAKTLYLWKGSGSSDAISYFEITRPRQTVITLSATGAYNHYTSSVVATLGAAMPELEILPQRASYVFNGYYDAPNGAGTMYYNGLGFGVQDWDKDVSTATLYAYWLEPCEVAPTLESTAPMTTIWDNQKVDIALAKLTCDYDTTGIHYSLLSASDAIAGCTFAYFDERIYIQGTPALGNSMIVTKTITFTMTNDCSPASTYTVDATIRIYPADRKARLAYIITGTQNGAFNAYSESDETNSSALLEYLRQFYTVNCVNGYATKDSAEIANYYNDYDLLIVTDFMETPLGYTNAIGTLIDKKPILSFEAYVAGSNGTNWHIGSNPADPSPKVKMMKVLCAGHTIFGDAEGVEVINKPGGVSDTTITVLSTTSGKGLQGFEINKAPDDFIFLATVRDENNHRNLIVSCERQAVFQARLLMYCINFNEMGNLTAAGKVVMHQMIDYLLMTDETKVADCSLVFDNHDGDHLWSNPANWAPGYNIVPTPFHGTRIIAECHVVNPDAHAGSIKVNKGRDEYGHVVDGKVIIEPTGGLTIAGVVQSVNDTRYASPSAIKAEDLLIKSDENNSGSLVYGNKESDVRATVRYYSRGDKALTSPEWQYMGIPFQASKTAIQMFRDAWMCRWSSATTDGLGGLWQWVDNYDVLIPFEGYCITQENKKTYEFNGKLNPPVTTIIDLDNRDEEGYAFAANSWTAPIKIQNMEDDDFENAEKAIYIYHTGSYQDYVDHGGATPISSKDGAAISQPGQYAVVPIHSSPYLTGADSVIPAMQGFFVKASAAGDASVRLVYNTTVYDAEYFCTSNQPMRAPRRDNAPDVMLINMTGQNYGDRVYILSRPDFSDEFEDGWDGRKVEGSPYAPMLSVAKQAGDMSIAALPTAEGRYLTFRAGVDTEYTVTFTYEGETIYLYDQLTREATRIRTGNTYSFTATNETPTQRFLITANPPQVPTGVSLVETEESLHFDNYGNAPVDVRIVDMQGRVVYTCNSTDQIVDIRPMLPYGVYLAHIKMGDDYKVVRMIGKEGAK